MVSVNPQIIINNNGVDLNALSLRTDVHNIAQDRLDFYCYQGNYNEVIDQSTINLLRTGSGLFNQRAKIQKAIEITLSYEEYNVYVALEQIARRAFDNNTPLTLTDYVNPETDDYVQGFTVRTGFINLPIRIKGLYQDTTNNIRYLMDGYIGFVFKENLVRTY